MLGSLDSVHIIKVSTGYCQTTVDLSPKKKGKREVIPKLWGIRHIPR